MLSGFELAPHINLAIFSRSTKSLTTVVRISALWSVVGTWSKSIVPSSAILSRSLWFVVLNNNMLGTLMMNGHVSEINDTLVVNQQCGRLESYYISLQQHLCGLWILQFLDSINETPKNVVAAFQHTKDLVSVSKITQTAMRFAFRLMMRIKKQMLTFTIHSS